MRHIQATELRAVKARCLALEANDQRSQERAATLAQQVGTEAAAKRQIENTLLDKVKELRASQLQVKGLEDRKRELNVELNSLSRKLRQYEARKYAEE